MPFSPDSRQLAATTKWASCGTPALQQRYRPFKMVTSRPATLDDALLKVAPILLELVGDLEVRKDALI
jgi:hypothetical protein